MQPKKPNIRMLYVWWLRMTVILIPLGFLSALVFSFTRLGGLIVTGLWVLAFLFFFCFYYPVKYHMLRYYINNGSFVVHCGVFYRRIKSIPLTNIQYTSVSASPFQTLFGVTSVFVFAAGAFIPLYGIKKSDAAILAQILNGNKAVKP